MEPNLIKATFFGTLSDPIPLETPSLISNPKMLEDILISSIARRIPAELEENPCTLMENTTDSILQGEYKIDFLKQDIIVVRGVEIVKVYVTNGEYKVVYANKGLDEFKYCAVQVQAPSGAAKPKGLCVMTEKPHIEMKERIFIP